MNLAFVVIMCGAVVMTVIAAFSVRSENRPTDHTQTASIDGGEG